MTTTVVLSKDEFVAMYKRDMKKKQDQKRKGQVEADDFRYTGKMKNHIAKKKCKYTRKF